MRLFIALNFTQEIKDKICGEIDRLKESSVQGNFTRRDNLHLTLVFLGETNQTGKVKQSMDAVRAQPFTLVIGGLGRFKRSGGDIYWLGVERNGGLTAVYRQLYEKLTLAGFRLESREYKPHLTLGREVILKDAFDCDFSLSVPVEKFSLMKSERINGKLTYTEIYSRKLNE